MQIIYTNKDLEQELNGVEVYFNNRANQKKYPQEYRIKLKKLMHDIYDTCKIYPNEELLKDSEIQKAFLFAYDQHAGQFRQFFGFPYIYHPCELASRLSSIEGITKEQIMAGLLHDTVEDCGVTLETIKNKFGKSVAQHVYFLTDYATSADCSREQRTNINFEHFIKSPISTKDIKIADLISNTRSLVLCNPGFAKPYTDSLEKVIVYFCTLQDKISLFTIAEKNFNLSKQVVQLQNNFNIIKIDKRKQNKPY